MQLPLAGAIDCDTHPAAPSIKSLLPYMTPYWRTQLVERALHTVNFTFTSSKPNVPLSRRADWRAPLEEDANIVPTLRQELLDPFKLRFAICNVLHGSIALFHQDMAAAIISAVNDWTRDHLLANDPRLRASILVSPTDPAHAVSEIERLGEDKRFVQILLPVMGELPLGRRIYWPIFEAAQRLQLPICIHAGSLHRTATTGGGWPSHFVEDYIAQSAAFENVLVSLLAEGVFRKFDRLTFVLAESGVSWYPALLWRNDRMWRATRREVPWIERVPHEIINERVRLTLQPFDGPEDAVAMKRLIDHFDSDRVILFSTDYPHAHFDGLNALPDGLSDALIQRIAIDNPAETYKRLALATDTAQPVGASA